MTVIFTRQSETWSKHATFPSNTAVVNYAVYNEPAADITIDEAVAEDELLIGDQLDSRPLYAKEITWGQSTPKMVTAVVKYDSTLFIPANHDPDTVQSVDDKVSGYVNTNVSATVSTVSWWRYQAPSAWISLGSYPWSYATVPGDGATPNFQGIIESNTSIAVDAAGTPLKRPVPGSQLTVSLTFPDGFAGLSTLRAAWRNLRGCRNNAGFLGDLKGEWLFTGANQRASSEDSLLYVELSFYRDPFGWCRQIPKSAPDGSFPREYLVEVAAPSGNNCGDVGTETVLRAACVYWTQLYPCLSSFSTLMTTAQAAQVVALIQ